MILDWTNELDKQLSWPWENQLRPRLTGLTDDEYFWEPVPVTTIAWRIGHLLVGVFGERIARHFGGPAISHAADALARLDDMYAQWIAGVRSLDDDGLSKPCGEHGFEQDPMAGLILHIHREVIHHG